MEKLKTILINNRYLVYCDYWVISDITTQETKDIPEWVFEIVVILQNNYINKMPPNNSFNN